MFDALIKVGGSLYNQAQLRTNIAAWAALAARYRLLFLPGGGPFANQIRAADAHFGLSDRAAHWMAILAMDQYSYLMADLAPQAVLVHDLSAAEVACAAAQLAILAPSRLLLERDPLPHSWQVTSDSIAAWLAEYAAIQRLILLKSVAGIEQATASTRLLPEITINELARYDIVDPYFPQALPAGIDCWIIDGGQPGRLRELLDDGHTVGTRILF